MLRCAGERSPSACACGDGVQDSHKTSQQADKLASQKEKKADKSRLKKVTFQISTSVLEPLDRLHLQLQLELGKKDAPYKEVIVEEAISNLLEMSEQDRNQLVESLLKRQSQRALKSKAWNQKSSGKKDR